MSTWVLLVFTLVGWALTLSLIEMNFNFKAVLKDIGAFLVGCAILLEQSHKRASNNERKSSQCFHCACFTYSIKCIQRRKYQKKSFEVQVIPFTHFHQIHKLNYSVYSKSVFENQGFGFDLSDTELNVESVFYKQNLNLKTKRCWDKIVETHPLGEDILEGTA